MGSGTGSRRALAALVCVAASGAVAGGCAAIDAETLATERDAAMARWSACVERHAATGDGARDAIEATRVGCDGYRRDVAATFAPHLGARVNDRLGERERRRVAAGRAARRAAGDEPLSVSDRLRERVERMLQRRGAALGDG